MKKWTRPRGFKPLTSKLFPVTDDKALVSQCAFHAGGDRKKSPSQRFTGNIMARPQRILTVEPHFLEVAQVSAALRYSVKEYGHLIDRQSRKFVEWFADRIEDEHLEKMMR